MANPYYNAGSYPSTGSAATSAGMRSELALIAAGFDKLPVLTGAGNQFVVVNAGGTALTTTATLPAASVNDNAFTFQDDADNTRKFQFQASGVTAGATRVYTVPDANTTLVGTDVTQTLTNKTISGASNTLTNIGNGSLTNSTLTLGSSTLTLGATTTSVAGLTLTGATVNGSVGATTPSTGAFTTLSASGTVSGAGFSTYLASPPAIGGTAAAAGSFTTLSASSTVSGAGFSTYLASPPAIGSTAAGTGAFTTLTASGNVTLSGGSLREKQTAVAASAIDLNTGNFFSKTISTTTTFTVSNVPSSGTAHSFVLDLTNGGSATVNWWTGVKWAAGTAPTLTAAGRDVLGFFTYDGGTTWTGLVLGKDVK